MKKIVNLHNFLFSQIKENAETIKNFPAVEMRKLEQSLCFYSLNKKSPDNIIFTQKKITNVEIVV